MLEVLKKIKFTSVAKSCLITSLILTLIYPLFAEDIQYSFLRINTSDGLVNNQTKAIFKDSRGFIWIGTSAGLSRFDGGGFRNFTRKESDSTSIIDNFIGSIQETRDGNILLKTRWEYALFDTKREIFLPPDEFLTRYSEPENVENIYIDKAKNLWIKTYDHPRFRLSENNGQLMDPFDLQSAGTRPCVGFYHDGKNYYLLYQNGEVECFNGRNMQLQYKLTPTLDDHEQERLYTNLFVDAESDVWIYDNNSGLLFYKASARSWVKYTTSSSPVSLSSNLISRIEQDKNGLIWIGTDHGGIDLLDKQKMTVTRLSHNPEDQSSISQNSITNLYCDDNGIMWVSTYKNGICYFHESIRKFSHYYHLASDPESLPFNDVNCFEEDKHGNLWIGTNGGGLIHFDRKDNSYKTYRHNSNDPNSLSNDVVVSLFIDDEGLLWIGTFTGGLNVFDGKRFTIYRQQDTEHGLPDDNIWAINQDTQKRIWIGTLGGGIVLFDKITGKFTFPPNQGQTQLPSRYVNHIFRMHNGDMFIGTALGIVFYNINLGRYQNHPFFDKEDSFKLSNNNVNGVYEDSRGLLWIATREGLTMIDPQTDNIKKFAAEDGLPEHIMNCIREDHEKSIWVSKSSGLSKIIVKGGNTKDQLSYTITNFTESDGLQGTEFNVNASLKTSRGELLFGGPNGFNLFNPENIRANNVLPRVVFTDLQIFNKSIQVGSKVHGVVVLDSSIVDSGRIQLKHSMNVFSIEFAALNFLIPDKMQYRYMLEGFDQDWSVLEANNRRVTYTNLNPGEYTLKVMASNNDGLWNDQYTSLQINILPPFYRTFWAYIIYFILIAGILLRYRYVMLMRERIRFSIEQERLQTKRHIEMDEMKLRFLTNVSHEFRTPLSLILAPLDQLKNSSHDEQSKKLLGIIEKNARQLLDLVNQLLDFRKLELHGLKYNPTAGDLIGFLREVCDNFSESFLRKHIHFSFESSIDSIHFQFDREKLQKIMMNLISNALKFTPEGGKVAVMVQSVSDVTGQESVKIMVKDTGIGIAKEDMSRIFDRFFQSERNVSLGISGSGIGLHLVKEMVLLHNGSIEVESEPGNGTTFTVILRSIPSEALIPAIGETIEEKIVQSEDTPVPRDSRQSILLVEDHPDFRNFMKETLQNNYDVFEATNGKDGFDKVHEYFPDIVISDVMMPEMDGLILCRKLKEDPRTSHIPIILLTARTADEDKIKGLEIGADDYITKPFNMELLKLRIQHLTDNQKMIHERFRKRVEINPSEIPISSIDEKLIRNAIGFVEKNIAEPKLSVEDLSHELGMSRVYLYKKLLAITGKTPIEFIRIMRLKRGAQLLEKSQMTVAEVAYSVGFNHPRYFSKYFEDEFGMLPSEYLKRNKIETVVDTLDNSGTKKS